MKRQNILFVFTVYLHKCDVTFEILLKLYQKTKKTMGVRGLKSFLEREKQCRTVNIGVEINKWKR